MNLSFVWRQRRLLVRWGVFMLTLAGLGLTLYAWLPPQPRWVVRGAIEPLGLAEDGKTFRTQAPGVENDSIWVDSGQLGEVRPSHIHSHSGPVQFWDVETGREVRRLFDGVSNLNSVSCSHDGRLLAALVRHTGPAATTDLHLVNLDTGRESHALIAPHTAGWTIHLSAGGSLLLLESTQQVVFGWFDFPPPQPSFLLFDTQTLRVLAQATGEKWQWRWAPDGDALLLYSIDKPGAATLRRVTAQAEASVALDGAGNWLGVAPDGRTLLTAEPQVGDGPRSSVLLWDTVTGKRRGAIPRWEPGEPGDLAQGFLLNGRALVIAQEESPGDIMAMVWDVGTQEAVGKVPLGNRRIVVSAEHDVFALCTAAPPNQVALYRPHPLARLWQRDLPDGTLGLEFLKGTRRLVAATGGAGERRLTLLDVETGRTCLDVPVLDHHRLVPRGRFLAVEETATQADRRGLVKEMLDRWFALVFRAPAAGADFQTTTRVFDTETGEELCRLDLRGATLADLSADGKSLFMDTHDRSGAGPALSCYDVSPRRRWVWIIGVPLVVGVSLLALRAGWRRLRPWRATSNPAADAARLAGGVPS